MKKYLLSILVLFFFVNTSHANTITDPLIFNFQGGVGEQFMVPFDSTMGPGAQISNVSATGPVNSDPVAWLNGPVNDGGLGVCNMGIGNDCFSMMASPTHALEDDETLTLTYTGMNPFELSRIYFLNKDNGTSFLANADFGFQVIPGVGPAGTVELFPLMSVFDFAMAPILQSGDSIKFFWGGDVICTQCGGFGTGDDYFIAGLVPIPAALPLFLSGLLGFAFFSRRKAKTA